MTKFRLLNILIILSAFLYSCDDSTPDIGQSTIPSGDIIDAMSKTFEVSTNSFIIDSVYARTSTAYLGNYTDPTFGNINADFVAQFTCTDNFTFPKYDLTVTGLKLYLQYDSFYGDSLAPMSLDVYLLKDTIPENSKKVFYTSFDPSKFLGSNPKPIASKSYSAGGNSPDTIFTSGSLKIYNQTVDLPAELGKTMYEKYTEDKNNYKDAYTFIKNVFKGIYVKNSSGNGSVLNIKNLNLRLIYDFKIKNASGVKDSLVTSYSDFTATREVIQANRFQIDKKQLNYLIENQGNSTYIKTPTGLLTDVTLPIDEISTELANDSINSANISFINYTNSNAGEKYPLGTPKYLLMIREKDKYSFFENNKIPDNETSFIASLGNTVATSNVYTFSNITKLINYLSKEKRDNINTPNWLTDNPTWNKMILVPVNVTIESGNITKVTNVLANEGLRLYGGDKKLDLNIIYSKFNR